MNDREVSWEAIAASIAIGVPVVHRRAGTPPVDFIVESGHALTLRVETGPVEVAALPRPRRSIVSRLATVSGQQVLELRCTERERFHDFHALMLVIAQRIQHEGVSPAGAFASTLASWDRLLQPEGL